MDPSRSLLALALAFGAGAVTARPTDPAAYAPAGFALTVEVEVPVAPGVAWDLFTGDVSGWWDHHLSARPRSLVIGRTPGSSFVEVVDEFGHGAEHARVTHAMRGELLRLVGPLGLVGRGVEIDATLRFAAAGDGTEVTLSAFVLGKIDAATAAVVEQVWRHFLVEQYAPYVRAR